MARIFSTLYNRFGSKEQLLEAVIDYSITRSLDHFIRGVHTPLKPKSGRSQIAGFCEIVLQIVTWHAAIGLQRMVIAQWPAFPALAERLAPRTSAAMSQSLAQLLKSWGLKDTLAQASTGIAIDILTSKGRLDRFVGLRRPYPLQPGMNTLDDMDHAAVHSAVQHLTGLRRL